MSATSIGGGAAGVPVPAMALEGVCRRFGHVTAVDDVWLDIREGEFFSLLGPSGCGKTTTLRMLAGFERPDRGTIRLRGRDVTETPPERRDTNLVFQHYELFPHMTVAQNVGYGLRLRKVREPELSARVREALRVVRAEELADRGARQLSGGQQQRVALARAIVNRPAVLLLDEPLSALDVKLRRQMQMELKAIQHALGTTFVYVTHDQEEALLLSDRIGVMHAGRLVQVATPRELYTRPADAFVADFVGSLNAIDGRITRAADGVATVRPDAIDAEAAEGSDGEAPLLTAAVPPGVVAGTRVRLAIRPERVRVARASDGPPAGGSAATVLNGTVDISTYLGAQTQLTIRVPGLPPLVATGMSDGRVDAIATGTQVRLGWEPDAAFVLPHDGAPAPDPRGRS